MNGVGSLGSLGSVGSLGSGCPRSRRGAAVVLGHFALLIRCHRTRAANDPSVFIITEKAPTRTSLD